MGEGGSIPNPNPQSLKLTTHNLPPKPEPPILPSAPEPRSLNPQLYTPNPEAQCPKPKPQTPNPKPQSPKPPPPPPAPPPPPRFRQTPNSKPPNRNPKPRFAPGSLGFVLSGKLGRELVEVSNGASEAGASQLHVPWCEPATRFLKPESWNFTTRNTQVWTRTPKPETRNPRPYQHDTRHPRFSTQNPKPETRNPKPETRTPEIES